MIDYAPVDVSIDQLIWQHIADSYCPADFKNYLRHLPESMLHYEDALERLIALDDTEETDPEEEPHYPDAIAEIEKLAQAGNAVAQFHMGKVLDIGTGVPDDRERAEAWYRLAVLQREPRSHINLALCIAGPEGKNELQQCRQLLETAATLGESLALFQLGRMAYLGQCEEGGRGQQSRKRLSASAHSR